jgi:acyl carrier protein
MYDRIKEIINLQLGRDTKAGIEFDDTLEDDLNADSLDAVEIIMAIEDEYDIIIPDEIAEKIETFEDIIDYLEETVGEDKIK